jgi:hypothetical protein
MKQKSGNVPDIYVVVLPEGAADLYQQVKQYVLFMFLPCVHSHLSTLRSSSFSDCQVGVATQCLKAQKCFHAKPQYYANVMLKCVLSPSLPALFTNPASGSMSSLEASTPSRPPVPCPSSQTPRTPPSSSVPMSSTQHPVSRTSRASHPWSAVSTRCTADTSPSQRCKRADKRLLMTPRRW